MNINRNNYETFFLLYVDNELSAAERKAVEEFLAENTDLYEELAQLQDVVLPGDDIFFTDKANLFKSIISTEEQENLLLHVDNELPAASISALEKSIAASETLKNEWQILKKTKLDPSEKIIFADKHLLYKKQKDNVIAGRFLRLAIAAAILGFGFFAAITFTNKKVNTSTEDVAQTNEGQAKKENELSSVASATNNDAQIKNTTNIVTANSQNNRQQAVSPKQNTGAVQKNAGLATNINSSEEKQKVKQETQTQQDDKQQVLLATNKKNVTPAQTISPERNEMDIATITPTKRTTTLTDVNILTAEKNSFAATASLNNEPNDNRILYMNEEDVSQSKAGSFFRKLKRTVERKTKIKTGGNLKIAGFEIALN